MEIFDYVMLSSTTKNQLSGNTYEFLIPPTYYNEQRSPVCRVEVVQIHLTKHSTKKAAYITTNLVANNMFYNKGKSVLGLLNNNTGNSYQIGEPLMISTSARPSKIDITFHEPDDASFQPDNFKLVLKFSYGNPKDTSLKIQYQN